MRHGRVIYEKFLDAGTVMTAFGQSHLNGWVSEVQSMFNVRPNQANGASQNQILDSNLTPEVSQNNDTGGVRRGI